MPQVFPKSVTALLLQSTHIALNGDIESTFKYSIFRFDDELKAMGDDDDSLNRRFFKEIIKL